MTNAHIKDGLSNTFLIGERTYWTQKRSWTHGANWFESRRSKSCVFSAKNLAWPPNSQGAQAGYAVDDRNAEPALRKVRVNDLMFGSEHSGGTYFLTAQGSVHFVVDTVDFTLLQDLVTIDGGEVASVP